MKALDKFRNAQLILCLSYRLCVLTFASLENRELEFIHSNHISYTNILELQ